MHLRISRLDDGENTSFKLGDFDKKFSSIVGMVHHYTINRYSSKNLQKSFCTNRLLFQIADQGSGAHVPPDSSDRGTIIMHANIYLFKLIWQFPLDKVNAKYHWLKIKSYSLVTLKLKIFFVHMTFVTFERLRFASKSDKSVLFRRSLLQRKLHHNSSIQYQFQLFFNGWSVMISFVRITQSLGSKHDFQWYRSTKCFYFREFFFQVWCFHFLFDNYLTKRVFWEKLDRKSLLLLQSNVLSKTSNVSQVCPEGGTSSYKTFFSFLPFCDNAMHALFDALQRLTMTPRIEEYHQSSFPSSVDSRGVEDLHLTDPQNIFQMQQTINLMEMWLLRVTFICQIKKKKAYLQLEFFFVSFRKRDKDKQMMVVSRLGSKTNNLYIRLRDNHLFGINTLYKSPQLRALLGLATRKEEIRFLTLLSNYNGNLIGLWIIPSSPEIQM